MKKLRFLGVLAMVLALGLAFTGCDSGGGDDGGGGGAGNGTSGLTISDGLPTGTWAVYVFSPETTVSGIASVGSAVATGSSAGVSGNTILLLTSAGQTWNGSGSFRVYRLIGASDFSGYKTVTFTNGSGTQTQSNIF
jgi:hypothetical protein